MAQKQEVNLNHFILNFREDEIQNVIYDWKLYQQGYEMHYAIDTTEIVSHFLPYMRLGTIELNEYGWAQKNIAYDFFFNYLGEENKVIVMDEYKGELLSIKNDIGKKIKNFEEIKQYIVSFFNRDYDLRKEGEILNIDGRDFELLVSLLGFLEKNEKGGIYEDFLNFLQTKLALYRFESNNAEEDDFLNNLFDESHKTELSKTIYSEFVDNNKYFLLRLSTDLERYVYLENTYRDVVVINRLLQINKQLSLEKNSFGKKIIYYISSTTFKSKRIIECKSVQSDLPNIFEFEKLNFHRNILQVFLFKILKEEFKNNDILIDEPLVILESLKVLVKDFHSRKEIRRGLLGTEKPKVGEELIEKNTYSKILSLLDKRLLSQIQNQLYFKIYEQKKESLSKIIVSNDYKQIRKIIDKIDSQLAKESHLMRSIDLQSKKYTNTIAIIESLKLTPLFNPIATDNIRNPFQHLPTLLFVSSEYEKIISNDFFVLLNFITETLIGQDVQKEKYSKLLDPIIEGISVQKKTISSINFDLIATNFFLTITKPSLIFYQKTRKSVIDNLEMHKSRLMTSIQSSSLNNEQHNLTISKKEIFYLTKEIDYFLIWLYRRDKRFESGIELSRENIKKNDLLGVFHQGLGLCLISNFLENTNLKDAEELKEIEKANIFMLVEAEQVLLTSIKIHSEYLHSFDKLMSIEVKHLIIKNIISINNSVANIYLKYFELGFNSTQFDNSDLLREVRKILKEVIIPYFSEIKLKFEDFATFNHTEAELEYYEALQLFNENTRLSISNALTKIMNATSRVATFQYNPDSMNERFFEVIKKINKLRTLILKRLDYI